MKKLTRRERALIQHARLQAVAEFKAKTTLTVEVLRSDDEGSRFVIRRTNLAQLEALNVLMDEQPFNISLGGPWRTVARIKTKLEGA